MDMWSFQLQLGKKFNIYDCIIFNKYFLSVWCSFISRELVCQKYVRLCPSLRNANYSKWRTRHVASVRHRWNVATKQRVSRIWKNFRSESNAVSVVCITYTCINSFELLDRNYAWRKTGIDCPLPSCKWSNCFCPCIFQQCCCKECRDQAKSAQERLSASHVWSCCCNWWYLDFQGCWIW